jgi:hypothetical protein
MCQRVAAGRGVIWVLEGDYRAEVRDDEEAIRGRGGAGLRGPGTEGPGLFQGEIRKRVAGRAGRSGTGDGGDGVGAGDGGVFTGDGQ